MTLPLTKKSAPKQAAEPPVFAPTETLVNPLASLFNFLPNLTQPLPMAFPMLPNFFMQPIPFMNNTQPQPPLATTPPPAPTKNTGNEIRPIKDGGGSGR